VFNVIPLRELTIGCTLECNDFPGKRRRILQEHPWGPGSDGSCLLSGIWSHPFRATLD